jgi:hypothetical protein
MNSAGIHVSDPNRLARTQIKNGVTGRQLS